MTRKERLIKEAANEILGLRTGWTESDKKLIWKELRELWEEGWDEGSKFMNKQKWW